jgi:uncharacterized protein YbbK (DUF523 family)/uncharacterized protein YbgA (DUF1722 family)
MADAGGRFGASEMVTLSAQGRSRTSTGPAQGWLPGVPEVRVGVSSCLLGQNVRYDGGHKADPVVQALGRLFRWIPVCPEMEVGMGTPREPVVLVDRKGKPRMVSTESGTDWTSAMYEFATGHMARFVQQNLRGFVLKSKSPSCALEDLPIYGPDGTPVDTGRGLFAQVLVYRMPLLPVEEERQLHELDRAASFVDEVLGYDRLLKFVRANPARTDLVRFHSRHELTLLARGSQHYRRLAHLAAAGRSASQKELLLKYAQAFMRALKLPATRANHARALRRASFQLESSISSWDKSVIDKAIQEYAKGEIPLSTPVGLVRQHIGTGASWLGGQSYFEPSPPEVLIEQLAS